MDKSDKMVSKLVEINKINSTRVASCKSLLSLDDMVLFKIISHLTISTLINVGETCKRLAYITQQQFKNHYSSVRWSKNCRNAVKLGESRKMFSHIGRHIQIMNLAIWSDLEFYEVLVILAHECTSLETLILDSIRINRPVEICHPSIDVMFNKLKRFVLNGCFWSGWCPLKTFFNETSTLEELCIVGYNSYNGDYKLYLSGFRTLKDLQLLDCQYLLTSAELQRCFENNNINTLSLCNISNLNIFEIHIIDALFDKVESLTLDYNSQIDLDQLVRLTKLKNIRLLCRVASDVHELLSKLSADIEKLEVTNIFITKSIIEVLKKFKNLTHLSFEGGVNSISGEFFTILPTILPNLQQLVYTYNVVTDYEFIHMFSLMPKLRYLSLFGCKPLAIDTYLKIVDILIQDTLRPKLKFIPPQLETFKSLNNLENIKRVMHFE